MNRAVVTIIHNEKNEVLLLERHSTHTNFPDEWCLPGGKIDFLKGSMNFCSDARYESPEEAAFRETEEETGIVMPAITDTQVILNDGKFLVYVFECLSTRMKVTKEFPNREHVSYGWFAKDKLPEKLGKMTRGLLEFEW